MKEGELCLPYRVVFNYKSRRLNRPNYVAKSNCTSHWSYRQHDGCSRKRPDRRLRAVPAGVGR